MKLVYQSTIVEEVVRREREKKEGVTTHVAMCVVAFSMSIRIYNDYFSVAF